MSTATDYYHPRGFGYERGKDRITVRMTGRRPAVVSTADWPCIATGDSEWYDSQVRCQAHRTGDAYVRVRQHADGRLLIYGEFSWSTNFPGQFCHYASAGAIYPAGADIAAGIAEIGEDLHDRLAKQARGHRVPRESLIDRAAEECIADLEPETI